MGIVSATVSIILRAIEKRVGFLGRIFAAIAGMAWTGVTFLALPIIVIENMSVKDAIKKSGNIEIMASRYFSANFHPTSNFDFSRALSH